MLKMPHRSVTRFFIPLIDVLTLLFAAFLVMPLVHESGDDSTGLADKPAGEQAEHYHKQADYYREETERLKHDIRQLRDKQRKEQRTPPRPHILEVDKDTGKLYDRDAPRTEISSRDQVDDLIERDKANQSSQPGWKIPYTIVFPRNSTKPTPGQQEEYEKWFLGRPDVAVYFDIPRRPSGGGRQE
jgi:hypothetical protein